MISSSTSAYCDKILPTFHFTSKADQAKDPNFFFPRFFLVLLIIHMFMV